MEFQTTSVRTQKENALAVISGEITYLNEHQITVQRKSSELSGKMAEAIMGGMISCGAVEASQITACDPNASRRSYLKDKYHVLTTANNASVAKASDILILAVKPQTMGHVLENLRPSINKNCLVVSIAAGFTLSQIQEGLGTDTVVRAMPNTPAAVGRGITAIVGNAAASAADLDQAEALLGAVGQVVRLEDEDQMDAVTGLSGSGPAYVFHMIECLAAAGEAEGLAPELAMQLAKATVAGAGALAEAAEESPAQLRANVTSPNGTTQAGLEVLMDETTGLSPLIRRTVAAAAARSRELRDG